VRQEFRLGSTPTELQANSPGSTIPPEFEKLKTPLQGQTQFQESAKFHDKISMAIKKEID
jgi:hypothetical protein